MKISTKKVPRSTKILISLVWNKILKIGDTLFELINIEVQCSKNKLKTFLQQEARAFGNNIGKEPQKATPKIEKYIFTQNICSAHNPMQVVVVW